MAKSTSISPRQILNYLSMSLILWVFLGIFAARFHAQSPQFPLSLFVTLANILKCLFTLLIKNISLLQEPFHLYVRIPSGFWWGDCSTTCFSFFNICFLFSPLGFLLSAYFGISVIRKPLFILLIFGLGCCL